MKAVILAFLKNKSIFNQKDKMMTSFGNKEKVILAAKPKWLPGFLPCQ